MLLSFALSMPAFPSLAHVGMIMLLVLGFGFIIFWHELGHFLAAKWVDIRVEQFAVGFGHAVVSWRKGIGFRFGSTQKEYREKAQTLLRRQSGQSKDEAEPEYTDAQIFAAADSIGLGETEYRLNYIPLGGYVKMAGQDDLKPDAPADDPRAYTKKSVGARMLVISAGVILNIILAAIGFMVLFMIGFNVAPAWVGNVIPGSPAQLAGLMVGDHILYLDGRAQQDFTKIMLNTALAKEGTPIKMIVDRPDNRDDPNTAYHRVELTVTPDRANGDKKFLAIGFSQPAKLEGVPKDDSNEPLDMEKLHKEIPDDEVLIVPGDVITAVNNQPIGVDEYAKFHDIIQNSHGQKVNLTIRHADGKIDNKSFQPHFEDPFDGEFSFGGMLPRVAIETVSDESSAMGKIMPLDVVTSISERLKDSTVYGWPHPSHELLMKRIGEDGKNKQSFEVEVIRDGHADPILVSDLTANVQVTDDRHGLGVGLMMDEGHTVLADVAHGSAADKAGLKGGDILLFVDGKAVSTWYQVQQILAQTPLDKDGNPAPVWVAYGRSGEKTSPVELKLDKAELQNIQDMRYTHILGLREYTKPRIASGPLQAAFWGVTETRDFVLQFYLTLRRMSVDHTVSPSSMMGPLGIFGAGKTFAYRGFDWLLWFLAMISANLAVVNFLPIPVVDGGQFMFLIFEKIKGKPLSARAMTIAQYVGLAFLAAVVLFVTYHDIIRHYG